MTNRKQTITITLIYALLILKIHTLVLIEVLYYSKILMITFLEK